MAQSRVGLLCLSHVTYTSVNLLVAQMATQQLARDGFRHFAKTGKRVINVPQPNAGCKVDNCNRVTAKEVNVQMEIQARNTCSSIMRTIFRVSINAINYVINTDVAALTPENIANLLAIDVPTKEITYIEEGNQSSGIRLKRIIVPNTVRDQCNATYGRQVKILYDRFTFDEETCLYQPALSFTATVVADDSLTPAQVASNITALGGTYASIITGSAACDALEAAVNAIWTPLATSPVTVALGAYE